MWATARLVPCARARSFSDVSKIRNVAIIAHVDHGKTTLVDCLLRQSGMQGQFKQNARHMDKGELEQERGITILSKATRINAPSRNDFTFNIVDTPGHADFGGEVERVMSMVEGVVLLVDACEGPKTQTKFVLQKALQQPGMKPLVVINKVDKPTRRDPGAVENEIFDLFVSLDATEEQLEYPTLYASAKNGICLRTLDEALSITEPNVDALFASIEECVPPPPVRNGEFSMLVSQLDIIPQLGPTVTGKVYSGKLSRGDKIYAKGTDGTVVGQGKAKEITVVKGLKREKVEVAYSGDIVNVSISGFMPRWTQTLCSSPSVEPVPCIEIDPPVLSVTVRFNDSPMAGKDGKYITLYDIGERLKKEVQNNVAIAVQVSPEKDSYELRGRGELQIGILIEEMRREGYEMSLSPPSVVTTKDEDGNVLEPWELVDIELPGEFAPNVIEKFTSRHAELRDMQTNDHGMVQLVFEISSRGFFGMRSFLKEMSGGQAVVASELISPRKVSANTSFEAMRNGALVSNATGAINSVDLSKLSRRGTLFVAPGEVNYMGMILGELHSGSEDTDTNVTHRHDGYAKADSTPPPRRFNVEQALSYLRSDECLEVTPKRICMRKIDLDPSVRKQKAKLAAKNKNL